MSVYSCFDVDSIEDVSVLRVKKVELSDLVLQSKFHDELVSFISEQRPPKLLINFQPVRYCATSIINSLVVARKETAGHKGELRLCEMSDPVRDAFRTLNLDGTLFKIFDTESAALEEF